MCPFDAEGVTYIYIVSILCSSFISASGGSTESGLEKGFITPQIIVYGLISNLLHVLYPRFGCASRPSPRQTRDIEPMLGQCWADVVDGGPAMTQHWFNVSCLLMIHARRASGECARFTTFATPGVN